MKLKKRDVQPGGLMPEDAREAMAKHRFTTSLAKSKTNENKWFYVAMASMLMTSFMAWGWHSADKRFAENVRVEWVKLSPNGTYVVEYAEHEKPLQYFDRTVESKLSEFVEKRYSKRRETISTDFGFASLMMSPELRTDFIENEKAPKVAADFVECKECAQIENVIRDVQSIDKDLVPGSKDRNQYNALIFSTFKSREKGGRITGCSNKIITLIWTFRPKEEILNKRDDLRYNPLGMEVIRSTIRDDPTAVSDQDCKKL